MKKLIIIIVLIVLLLTFAGCKDNNKIWSGEWKAGSITADIGDYTIFKIEANAEQGSETCTYLACLTNDGTTTKIKGGGNYSIDTFTENAIHYNVFEIIVDGDTLTLDKVKMVNICDGEFPNVFDNADGSYMTITAIYGVE